MPVHGHAQLVEQQFRDRVVQRRIAARRNADVRAGPHETVEFTGDDPASRLIQAKLALDPGGYFHGVVRVIGRAVRHRSDGDLGQRLAHDPRDDDDGGAILQALVLSPLGLARPQIGVADDVSRARDRP